MSAERDLWIAVLHRLVIDLNVSKYSADAREREAYRDAHDMFTGPHNRADLKAVCENAGFEVEMVVRAYWAGTLTNLLATGRGYEVRKAS